MQDFTEADLVPTLNQPVQTGLPSDFERPKAPPISDVLYSAAHLGNSLFSAGDYVDTQSRRAATGPLDASFDPFAFAHQMGDEDHIFAYVDVKNQADAAIVHQRIADERAMADTLSRGGPFGTVANIGAGILDPINLIPLGEAVKGGSILRQGLKVGAESAGVVGLTELGMHTTQDTRTAEESYWNMAGAAAFGGLLGTGFAALKGKVGEKGVTELQQRFTDELRSAADPQWQGGGSLSSASARRATTLDQEAPASAFGLEKIEAKNPISDNPLMRSRLSPSVETRRISGELAETPFFLKGNAEDIASPTAVESLIKQWHYPLAKAEISIDDAFARYRSRVKDEGGSKLSKAQFEDEVSRAARRGDTHEIPEVAEAAKASRRHVLDPLKEEAVKGSLLPEGVEVTTAASYLMRLYDKDLISANRNDFVKRLADQFEIDQLRAEEKASRAELEAQAEDITNQILGNSEIRTPYDVTAGPRGPLKERTLNVPDEVVEPYLVNNIKRVLRAYTRTMAADVELTRQFGRPDMADQLARIGEDYDKLQKNTPDGAKQSDLGKRRKRDISDIEAMRDRIRGTYALPDNPQGLAVRSARFARNFNFVRALGGMTVSSLPDMAGVLFANGFTRGLGHGAQMLMRSLPAKLAEEEVRLSGTALDMVLHSRVMDLNDVFAETGRYSKPERGMEWLASKMGRYSLMDYWNTSMKQWAGLTTQTRMLQTIEAGEKASANDVRNLRKLGIDGQMADRIRREFRKSGVKDSGVWTAGTSKWTDQEAARAFRAGLVKEVDRIIVSPGQEKPLWMSKEWGKTVGQFKTFMFSSMSRTLIHGLQARDANTMGQFTAMLGLGMLSVWLKAQISGRELPADPAQWIAAGVDASGLASWIFEANNISQKTLGVGMPLAPQRYASRSGVESLLGPSAGLVNDTLTVARDAAGSAGAAGPNAPRFSSSDVHRIRKLIPFNNLFYLRQVFDQIEHGANTAAGLPERNR